MSIELFREAYDLITKSTLTILQPDGGTRVDKMRGGMFSMPMMAHSYLHSDDDSLRGSDELLDAIVRMGDFNARGFDAGKGFGGDPGLGISSGWDEWRAIAWLEAAEALGDRIDADRKAMWMTAHHAFGEHILSHCQDMDTFDGQIPNHGIWNHVYFWRVGQLLNEPRFKEMTTLSMGRIVAGQTADGCWREGQTTALFAGTPVTNYNTVSALAVNLYAEWSGDPAAFEAMDRSWRWFYDYLLPDYSTPPNFSMRQPYAAAPGLAALPAYFLNQPEGRQMGTHRLSKSVAAMKKAGGVRGGHGWMFGALQFPFIRPNVQAKAPSWPEYKRMQAEEACVRRRAPWTAHLCGATNISMSNMGMRLFTNERQDLLSLYHEELGLLVGSAHGKLQEELSTFVFYETGNARYLHDQAYLKSSPALDTLLLRYGSNIGAASVDSTDPKCARMILSIHGERGHNDQRGTGHPISAMAAKAHMTLRLKQGDVIRHGDREFQVEENDEQMLRLRIAVDEKVSFGAWSLTCTDGPWELRWPVRAINHYKVIEPGEFLAVVEAVLYPGVGILGGSESRGVSRPTATFHFEA